MVKISEIFVFAALALATVEAHSWLHCADYTDAEGDITYNPAKCKAFPRNAARFLNSGFGADTGYNQQTKGCGRDSRAAGQSVDSFYTAQFPMAKWSAGQKVCMTWPAKNHAASRGNPYIPDAGTKLWATGVNPTSDPTDFPAQATLFHDFGVTPVGPNANLGFPRIGFQNCPDFGGASGTDRTFCYQCFQVPQVAAGRYTIQWAWAFNGPTDIYANCMDVDIAAGNGGANPPPPAQPPAQPPAASQPPAARPSQPPTARPSQPPTNNGNNGNNGGNNGNNGGNNGNNGGNNGTPVRTGVKVCVPTAPLRALKADVDDDSSAATGIFDSTAVPIISVAAAFVVTMAVRNMNVV